MRRPQLLLLLALAAARGDDFCFWQLSDLHAPVPGTTEVVAEAAAHPSVVLSPFGLTAPPPAFALLTGDLTEFGPGDGAWQTHHRRLAPLMFPLYPVPGNHDNTWWLIRPTLAAEGRRMPYAFDHGGCHFVCLDSASRQDPRPSFGVEELRWLQQHLRGLDPATPLFLAFHHPFGSEWSSPYDYERLLELLQPYQVALILVGHGHNARRFRLGDCDAVMGGSTFDGSVRGGAGGNAGFAVIDVRGGTLRVTYKRRTEETATLALLEKPMQAPPSLPAARFAEPAAGAAVHGDEMAVRVSCAGAAEAKGTIALNADDPAPLAREGDLWRGSVKLAGLPAGRYVLRARFEQGERVVLASREFTLELPDGPRAVWRTVLPSSVRGALALDARHVYAAAQDGDLYALDRATGAIRWRFATLAECVAGPCVDPSGVYVAATDGVVYALDPAGGERWRYDGGRPFVAPPIRYGELLVAPAVDGTVHAVEAATGRLRWQVQAADYTIETAVCPAGDRLVVGAWDTFVRGLAAADGRVLWKTVGEGSSTGAAARYYSPADGAPVVVAGRAYVPDRKYKLSILGANSGERLGAMDEVAGVGVSQDGAAVYLRRAGPHGNRLTKLAGDGKELWTVAAAGGYLAVPPTERDGVVVVTSDTGLLTALSATDGELLWRYRIAPGFWVPGGAIASDGVVYAAALDGSVTAIAAR
ncbi:MAG: PQQ-binding-like beta-propeller repeat protein [Armatimonadetes bacterium]|nr:PQQ-binding-like beta-propeller repeat protein [Armatimonadota bacterium]